MGAWVWDRVGWTVHLGWRAGVRGKEAQRPWELRSRGSGHEVTSRPGRRWAPGSPWQEPDSDVRVTGPEDAGQEGHVGCASEGYPGGSAAEDNEEGPGQQG